MLDGMRRASGFQKTTVGRGTTRDSLTLGAATAAGLDWLHYR
jgi:hypothetical protein